MIVEATQRGRSERILAVAHQTALLSRQEKLKPLAFYLNQSRKPKRPRDQSLQLAAMFDRMIERQKTQPKQET